MTPNEIELIRKSFAKVAPIADAAAAIFYEKLFAYDPSVRPMFKGDISEQGKKLISVLATVVQNLDKLETIEGAVAVWDTQDAGTLLDLGVERSVAPHAIPGQAQLAQIGYREGAWYPARDPHMKGERVGESIGGRW